MSPDTPSLPDFIPPMLAKIGEPFDSGEHLFELKWDGFRGQALIEHGGYRLLSRQRTPFTLTYPELGFLHALPSGLALDGELVLLKDGRPSFESMLQGDQGPVTYVVFDVMYRDFDSLMDRPLSERRKHLVEVVEAADNPRLVLSDGVVGDGLAFFEQVRERRFEGMVAKRLDSTYECGLRTGAWTKIKETKTILCAILGYAVDDAGGLKSLIIATNDEEGLRCVGKVGSGLSLAMVEKLKSLCDARPAEEPLVACDMEGRWVAPGLYCKVRYNERTSTGMLRAPVFRELITDESE